jgi:hypothetical protein
LYVFFVKLGGFGIDAPVELKLVGGDGFGGVTVVVD